MKIYTFFNRLDEEMRHDILLLLDQNVTKVAFNLQFLRFLPWFLLFSFLYRSLLPGSCFYPFCFHSLFFDLYSIFLHNFLSFDCFGFHIAGTSIHQTTSQFSRCFLFYSNRIGVVSFSGIGLLDKIRSI